jgi:hypothetical protein
VVVARSKLHIVDKNEITGSDDQLTMHSQCESPSLNQQKPTILQMGTSLAIMLVRSTVEYSILYTSSAGSIKS